MEKMLSDEQFIFTDYGKCLKNFREKEKIYLWQMGNVIKCSSALVSRLENGIVEVNMKKHIWPILQFYSVSLYDFINLPIA